MPEASCLLAAFSGLAELYSLLSTFPFAFLREIAHQDCKSILKLDNYIT
jgi:hypothetical protein